MLDLKAKPGCCEEAALGVPFYAPCNQPAVAIVGWKGRSDKPIRMCAACMDHNLKNRGGELIRYMSDTPMSGDFLEEQDDNLARPPAPADGESLCYRVYVEVRIHDLTLLRAAALARAIAAGMGAEEFANGEHDEPADNASYWLGWFFDSGTPENCGFEIENSGCDLN